jgi:signal transduction histidine kinase
MLNNFIATNREEIIDRARTKVRRRAAPRATTEELTNGVPKFLDQLVNILTLTGARYAPDDPEMGMTASRHGNDLLQQGFTIAQVVHDYGEVCQAVTDLALDLGIPITTEDFQTLNRCLDFAIASAVTEYARQHDVDVSGAETRRQGFFAHELRNHLNTAALALQVVKSGKVGVTGNTIDVLERSLRGLRGVIDRSLSEVRLATGSHHKERIGVGVFIEEMEIDALVDAANRGLQFTVAPVDNSLFVEVDRQLFASAVSNVLQNAFKFNRPSGQVWLRVGYTDDHVFIEIEDECGGLQAGATEALFRPFEQRATDRTGLGLGLTISRQAIEADGGKISVRDIPGRGCVFTIEIPREGAAGRADAPPLRST